MQITRDRETIAILTGAGFSKNWGGLLTNELGYMATSSNGLTDEARSALARTDNFETLMHGHSAKEIQAAIIDAFHTHEQLIAGDADQLMSRFAQLVGLWHRQFDIAWFTLNYDLLVERHWPNISEIPSLHIPLTGFRKVAGDLDSVIKITKADSTKRNTPAGYIPYCKLHGSIDWIGPDGTELIIGQSKPDSILASQLHSFHWSTFESTLAEAEYLLIIGYGFGDPHVNKQIVSKARRIVVINPSNPPCDIEVGRNEKDEVAYDMRQFSNSLRLSAKRPLNEILPINKATAGPILDAIHNVFNYSGPRRWSPEPV